MKKLLALCCAGLLAGSAHAQVGLTGLGNVAPGNMPALTGSCTTTAGTVAVTCEQDGAWTTTSGLTITHASGTAPTTESAVVRWKLLGSKTYSAVWTYTVTTLGAGTGGFINLQLPNAVTSGANSQSQPCNIVNATTGNALSPSAAYIQPSVTVMQMNIGTLAANVYAISCTFEIT